MKWLRLPIALSLFLMIWWVFPVQSWRIEKDRLYLQSAKNLTALSNGQKVLLEARIYPNQKDIHYYDGAFIYEREVQHKANGTATETDIFAAERPSVKLIFQDSSSLVLPQVHYVLRTPHLNNKTSSSTLSNAEYLPKLRVAKQNYKLRLANPLAEREHGENIKSSLKAKGFRTGDSVLLYACVQQGQIEAEIMDRGGLKQHQQDMTKQERVSFWLGLFLRGFLSLLPLGILQGLWRGKRYNSVLMKS